MCLVNEIAYIHFPAAERDVPKIAVCSPFGSFEYKYSHSVFITLDLHFKGLLTLSLLINVKIVFATWMTF